MISYPKPSRTTNSKGAAKMARKGVCQDEINRFLLDLLKQIARQDRSLRARRAHIGKALSKDRE